MDTFWTPELEEIDGIDSGRPLCYELPENHRGMSAAGLREDEKNLLSEVLLQRSRIADEDQNTGLPSVVSQR